MLDHGGPVDRPFAPFPSSALGGSIAERFAATARRYPRQLALSDRESDLTYAELVVLVDRIAAATVAAAAGRPGPIAILLGSELTFPAAMLGVLTSGRGFVPLDASNPDERNRLIAVHSGAAAVISCGALAKRAAALFPDALPVIDLAGIGNFTSVAGGRQAAADDLACILYTSGSTGAPKGAYHSHRNVLHDVMQQTNALHLDAGDRVALLYSPTMIAGIREIMLTLLNGASLHILPPRDLQASGLVRAIEERGITICRTVPPLLRRIVEALSPGQRLESVRIFGLGSQRVDWSDYDLFRRCCSPSAKLIVGIGSTECGGNYCHWFVDERLRTAGGRLPIGRVLPDASVTIADDAGWPVAQGEVGEFVLASRYLALGYWRDPHLSAQVFSVDPADPGIRILRTGDRGRKRPDGLLEFVGRADQQIKLRGHRVELGEIELALAACPGVQDAAVVARTGAAGVASSLAAYVEPSRGPWAMRPRDLRLMLSRRLPGHMVPATIQIVEQLPRLPNLKVDRVKLKQMDAARLVGSFVPTDDPMIAAVIRVYESVLGEVRATPEDNVSSLGGDSLQAIRIVLELERALGIAVPPDAFESAQTIRELARWIAVRTGPLPVPRAAAAVPQAAIASP